MVQRKAPKLSIKTHHLISNPQLSSPQTHEKLNKIMKKSRPIKRSDEPPSHHRGAATTPLKQSPNYMKSTTSFEARKEQSPKGSKSSKTRESTSGNKGSRTTSLKTVKTLTKNLSFKPLRPSKKVILCDQDLDVKRPTCSSTLKESKFPNFLQLVPGGTELDGTTAMKVCPYTYCSLNGHHHDPLPPLKCFLSARRRALKNQKSFKLGCLSPRQTKPDVKKNDEIVRKETEEPSVIDSRDYSKENLECSRTDWDEGNCLDSYKKDVCEEQLWSEIQYDEESVSSGAWSDEHGDFKSDGSYEMIKINQEIEDQDFLNEDETEVSSTTTESVVNDKIDEFQVQNLPIGEANFNYQPKEASEESKTAPDYTEKSEHGTDRCSHITIIYNIILFNISVFVNGDKTEHHPDTDRGDTVKTPETVVAVNKMKTEEVNEAMEEQSMSKEGIKEQSMINEEMEEPDMDKETKEEQSMSNLRGMTRGKKCEQEIDENLQEFNLRGPNFLAEVADPDAETVDLKHQMMDERKNADEWMVDFALRETLTRLEPARKKKVALLVEAFEKVMPISKYNHRHASKAFSNERPLMQACT